MTPQLRRRRAAAPPRSLLLLLLLLVLLASAALLPGAAARKRSVRYGHQGRGRGRHMMLDDAAQHAKAMAAVSAPSSAGLWALNMGKGDPAPGDDGGGGGSSEGGSGSPFDDQVLDETLGFSLLALTLWAVASALLVAGFIRQERRQALLLRFWGAIHARPELKRAVEQAAGGHAAFPAPPRHSVLRRFLRATAIALVVTFGLNLVLMTATTNATTSGGTGDDDGGSGGGSGGSGSGGDAGGGSDPFDPSSADGAINPLLAVVFALLFGASTYLVVRGLHACFCRGASDDEEETGAGYAPLAVDASNGNGNGTTGASAAGVPVPSSTASAYFIGIPVVPSSSSSPSAPPHTPRSEQAQEDEAPPPYSAAAGAVPAALV